MTEKPTGRPTDCTKERTAIIVAALKQGCYVTEACAAAGITKAPFYIWMKRGEAGEQPFADFASAVKDAKAEAVTTLLSMIRNHAAENWQAAAWILERRYYRRWGRKSQVDAKVTQTNGPKLDVLSGSEYAKVLRALADREDGK